MKISITHYGNTTSFESERDDQDIAEMVSIIKGMMVSVGFHPSSVDDYFVGAEGEWFPDLEEKTKKALSFPELEELSMTEEPKLSKTKMDTLIDGVKGAFD
jgi:hypothetical protein